MRTRADAARLIEKQLSNYYARDEKGGRAHYGKMELIELMDFIYGEPKSEEEKITCSPIWG